MTNFFNNAQYVYINGKEVQSIVLTDSGGVLYEKQALEPLVFTFSGTTLTQYSNGSFSGTNMIIDYGDGTIESTTGKFGHTYSEDGTYQVKIYGVTRLGNSCFSNCTGLTSITIPDSISSLGNSCFFRCSNLTSIEIPNSISSLEGYCFRDCTNLASIELPNSITSIRHNCFLNCTALTSIQLNWTSNDILTYNSDWIPNISSNLKFHIPYGTTQLYIDKGYPSDKLEEPPVMTLTVTGSSFETYSSTPFTYTGEVFVDWGDDSGIIEYTGDKLTHNFTDELNLHTVKIYGDITSLGNACFYNCTGLTSIVIPDSVTSLGNSCFHGCTGLTSIVIPDSVTSLKNACFSECTSLTSINIPSSVTSLGKKCFRNCDGLTSITIPDSVTSIVDECFRECSGLTSIQLNWRGNYILTYNSNWISNASSNLKFHIPAGTKQLYINKGYPMNKLVEPLEFTFSGTTLTQYSDGSFSGTNMMIDYGDGTVESTTGKFGHTYNENGTYQVKIYGVTSLETNCFRDCSGLTSIDIPNNITSLGDSCFRSCTGLTSITIPPSVTNLGMSCFYHCSGLTSIDISNSVTSLKNYCFSNCTGLTSITIPNSVTSLGSSCFDNCTGLRNITIPNSVTSLGTTCFYRCTSLTSINIPSSVTAINGVCFYGCTGLTSILLNWNTSTNILTYDSTWLNQTNSSLKLSIPNGTTSLYTAKKYPSSKLQERT